VFGHSHIPMSSRSNGQHILNPGSPTDKRTQPHHTLAVLDASEGEIQATRIIELD